jgi:hypothetical protein
LAFVDEEPFLVGHSSASTLVADLATKMPVRGLIIVDGDIPPASGSAAPVRASFREFISGLADQDGLLPPWSQWWVKGTGVAPSLLASTVLPSIPGHSNLLRWGCHA